VLLVDHEVFNTTRKRLHQDISDDVESMIFLSVTKSPAIETHLKKVVVLAETSSRNPSSRVSISPIGTLKGALVMRVPVVVYHDLDP
jgi:hypothetical protein